MKSRRFVISLIMLSLLLLLLTGVVQAKKGGGEETAGNNLSFPVIALDNFSIATVAESFSVEYVGEYPGLTAEQINYLEANGPWYAQKVEGNTWQAGFVNQTDVAVSFINWGDNIESVYPKVRTPFRLEVTLYKILEIVEETQTTMKAFTMAELEYPSSSKELQGTNTTPYDSIYATIISNEPKLVVQYLGSVIPTTTLVWQDTQWCYEDGSFCPNIIPVAFGPELNVGGKYIYGASEGGWKPDQKGFYRITFYVPEGSGIDLSTAYIDNFPPVNSEMITPEADEGSVATPVVIPEYNLTYVDVQVVGGGKNR